MTVGVVLTQVSVRYPHAYEDAVLRTHLTRLENMARRELYQKPHLTSALTDQDTLVIASPYDGIYEHYITAMLAQMDGENARYNAELGLYATLWNGLQCQRRREVLPCAKSEVKRHV